MASSGVVRCFVGVVIAAWAAVSSGADGFGRERAADHPHVRLVIIDNADVVLLPDAIVARLHDYGSSSLVRLTGELRLELASRTHPLPDNEFVSFRSWSDRVAAGAALPDAKDGVWVVRLIGPLDRRWRDELESYGVEVLAPAHPSAFIARASVEMLADAMAIMTSEGYPVIVGFAALPDEARLHRSLVPVFRGAASADEISLRAFDFAGRPVSVDSKRVLRRQDLGGLLAEHPEIGYVEPVLTKQPHNNLAARSGLLGVEEPWGGGFDGDGVTVLHNDSGVDLEHPGLAGSVTASIGRMAYADTAHGTHTAGSIVGSPIDPAPVNTSGCGDVIQRLPAVSGMAPGASLITNNVFREGLSEIPEMMAWGAAHGAQLSNNSWGLLGQTGPDVGYSAAAVEVDAAVRDADPSTDGAQPMTVFFSAGNTGPETGTVTSPGTAKNAITIGATQNARCGAWIPSQQPGPDTEVVLESSGRGPSQQRAKPDLVAPGSDVLSLESQDSYAVQLWDQAWTGPLLALNTGTSQACALATGAGAVLHEVVWRMSRTGRRPSPALLKAALIATAEHSGVGIDFDQGWGRIALSPMVFTALPIVFFDEGDKAELTTGESTSMQVAVRSAERELDLALVWSDVPGEADADHPLVNDLDLVATSPSGRVYRGNVFDGGWSQPDPGETRDSDNNVEVVRVEIPEEGIWSVRVIGVDVPSPPAGLGGQDFALVATGDVGACLESPPPPANVVIEPAGSNAIRLQWTPVVGATKYQVARATRRGGRPYEIVATVGSGVTSLVDEGLSGGTTYYYVVRAERLCWSRNSYEVYATASGPCTNVPIFDGLGSVTPAARAACTLELSWAPAEATCPSPVAYDIFRGVDPGFAPSADNRIVERLISDGYTDRGLEPDREYFYVVRASHTHPEGDEGNSVRQSARTIGPDDEYLSSTISGFLTTWHRIPGSAADSGTEPWFRTDDDAWDGPSSWFVEDEPSVKDQVLQLTEPLGLVEGEPPLLEFHHRLRLDRGRDGGRLEYSTNGGRDWFDILSGDGQTVPENRDRFLEGGYTDTIAAASNPLYLEDTWSGDSEGWVHTVVDLADFAGRRLLLRWRFAADDTPGLDWGWWVDGIRLFVERECQACVPPDPPQWLQDEVGDGGVELSWPGVPFVESYQIHRSTVLARPFEHIATVAAPSETYRDTDVSGGTTYHYVVKSVDDCVSDESMLATATATGPCTLAPDFWGLDEVIDRREPGCALDLVWRPAEPGCAGGDPRYNIYRSMEAGFEPGPETRIAEDVAGSRYRDLGIGDREAVFYRVRAVDGISGAEEANPVVHGAATTGPDELLFSDSVEQGSDGWWTAVGSGADTGTEAWRVVDDRAFDGERSWFCANEPQIKDQVVGLLEPLTIDEPATVLAFHHLFDLEPFWDGGRLEYSTDGGSSWHDILSGDGASVGDNPNRFLRGGYSGFVSAGTGHPFGGEPAWTGWVDGWLETIVDLDDFVGLTVAFRWRLGCDRSDARVGWWLDDLLLVQTTACTPVVSPGPRPTGVRRP